MRRLSILTLLLLTLPVIASAARLTATETAAMYFDAVTDGDTVTIRKLTASPLLDELKPLLTRNEDYPAFLRDRYQGAVAEIGSVTGGTDDEQAVVLRVGYPDGHVSTIRLTLEKQKSGKWKVVGQQEILD